MLFNLPVKIILGKNVIKENSGEFSGLGSKALLVTGKHSALKSGAQADLLEVLNQNSIDFTIYNEINENPDIESIVKGAKLFNENQCDFIIGIGGGSPLDAAKAISLMAANNLTKDNIYDSNLHKKAFPLIAVPTTSGTGSEATPYSVLTNSETMKKAGFGSPLIFPKIAFADPRYTFSLNETVTRDTAIDALSHLLEGIYSNKNSTILKPFIFEGVKLIIDNLEKCINYPDNYAYRENLMLASVYGGIVIAHTSTTLQHSIGYPLTTVYGLSHGFANGVVMKDIMNLYYEHLNGRLDELFTFLKISKEEFFNWLDKFNLVFNGKISDEFLQTRIPEVMNSRNMALNPLKVNEEQIKNIYLKL